jgi:hypothetical protein
MHACLIFLLDWVLGPRSGKGLSRPEDVLPLYQAGPQAPPRAAFSMSGMGILACFLSQCFRRLCSRLLLCPQPDGHANFLPSWFSRTCRLKFVFASHPVKDLLQPRCLQTTVSEIVVVYIGFVGCSADSSWPGLDVPSVLWGVERLLDFAMN